MHLNGVQNIYREANGRKAIQQISQIPGVWLNVKIESLTHRIIESATILLINAKEFDTEFTYNSLFR